MLSPSRSFRRQGSACIVFQDGPGGQGPLLHGRALEASGSHPESLKPFQDIGESLPHISAMDHLVEKPM